MTEIVLTLIVSPILQEALARITSFAARKRRNAGDVENQLGELRNSLVMTDSLLRCAEKIQDSDPAISLWLRNLEDAAYDVVDLLDEYDYDTEQKQVRKFLIPFPQLKLFSFTLLANKVKHIKETLDKSRQDATFINLIKDLVGRQHRPDQAQFFLDTSHVLGRENDVQEIENSLLVLTSQHRLSGICIVGMAGVGKTAVARLVYENARMKGIYDFVFWVFVFENFDARRILREMLEFVGVGGMTNIHAMIQNLEEKLRAKSFLLILDGVWYEDVGRCCDFVSELARILRTTANSSIVVTTSDKQTAFVMETMKVVPMHKHELQKLSKEQCWSVIEKTVLEQIETIPPILSATTRNEIAEQCGGLPLAAFVIGKYLGGHIEENKWAAVKDNQAWDSPYRKSILIELKRTSYDRLASPLKKCFSYCSIFPKGSEIRRDELVQLWLAKGYLQLKDAADGDNSGNLQQEDVGNEYFNDLVSNYLLEDVTMDEFGNIKSCKVNDVMHNLALLVSQNQTCICSDNHPIGNVSNIRHVRVMPDANLGDVAKIDSQRLRSLFLETHVPHTKAMDLSRLRSLKTVAQNQKALQASLGKSKNLKYLDISESGIEGMPASITEFYSLQTLRYTGCESLKELPGDILEKLVSLRHIYCDERHMPSRIGKLKSLQTLALFVVGTRKGRGIGELKCLNLLRGEMKICNLEKVSELDAIEAKLEDKVNLFSLQFVWGGKNRARSNNDEGVLKCLRPNSNLKSLTIENYKGSNFPSWMVDISDASFCLQSLLKLELVNCDECGDISSLGLLPELKFLTVKAMLKVVKMGSNFHDVRSNTSITLFPALRKLRLHDMESLEEWIEVEDMSAFPFLEELYIFNCPLLETWRMNGGSTSLQLTELSIESCQKLYSISSGVKSKVLDISDCPNLRGFLLRHHTPFDRIRIDGRNLS